MNKFQRSRIGIELDKADALRVAGYIRAQGMTELADQIDAKINPKQVTVCAVCGSPDIEYEVWSDSADVQNGDCGGDMYCGVCEEHGNDTVQIDAADVLDPTVRATVPIEDEAEAEMIDEVGSDYVEHAGPVIAGRLWNLAVLAEELEELTREDIKRPYAPKLRAAATSAAAKILAAVEKAKG